MKAQILNNKLLELNKQKNLIETEREKIEKDLSQEIDRLDTLLIDEIKKSQSLYLEKGKVCPIIKEYDSSKLNKILKINMPKEIREEGTLIAKMVELRPFRLYEGMWERGFIEYSLLPQFCDPFPARTLTFRFYPSKEVAEIWDNLTIKKRQKYLRKLNLK